LSPLGIDSLCSPDQNGSLCKNSLRNGIYQLQFDEELRTALLKMKDRAWTDLLLVVCDMSRYIERGVVEGMKKSGKAVQ